MRSRRDKFTLSRHLTRHESAISHPASGTTSLPVAIQTQILTGRMVTLDNNYHILDSVCRQTLRQCPENTSLPFFPFPFRNLLQPSRSSASDHIQGNKLLTLHFILLYFTSLYFTALYCNLLHITALHYTSLYFTLQSPEQ